MTTPTADVARLVERLRNAAGGGSWPRTLPTEAAALLAALAAERDALQQRLDATERDAERLDYLENNPRIVSYAYGMGKDRNKGNWTYRDKAGFMQDVLGLRAAIDAALEGGTGGGA